MIATNRSRLAISDSASWFTEGAVVAVTAAAAYASQVRPQRERTLLQARSVADAVQAAVMRVAVSAVRRRADPPGCA